MTESSGVMHVDCNICGCAETDEVTVQNSCHVVRCVGCGFVFVNPRPDVDAYEDLYVDYLPDRMEDPLLWKSYMRVVFSRAADLIESMVPARGRSIDIGCGFGFFVEEMRNRGWLASGLDISPTAVGYARKMGLDVSQGILETAELDEGAFDAVTMFYVLEHVPDPLATLGEVKRLLKPGGVLLLRLPHTTPIVRLLDLFHIKNNLYDPPFHLSDFSPAATRAILEKAGYTDVRTVIGGATLPGNILPKLVSLTSTAVAETLQAFSFGKFLLPGVSKTTVARRP